MPTAARIYMASPLGFSEAGSHFSNAELLRFVAGLGYEVLDPWALADQAKIDAVQRLPYGPEKREAWRKLNREIGATNQAAIDRADGVVAVLDGTDVDSGTAAEIGYAFARGKLIVGYRGDFRLSADNEGSTVNLQVEFFIHESGGAIVSRYEDLKPCLRPWPGTQRPGLRVAPRPAGPQPRDAPQRARRLEEHDDRRDRQRLTERMADDDPGPGLPAGVERAELRSAGRRSTGERPSQRRALDAALGRVQGQRAHRLRARPDPTRPGAGGSQLDGGAQGTDRRLPVTPAGHHPRRRSVDPRQLRVPGLDDPEAHA